MRTRAPNFAISETILLCKILNKHKRVIENKKNDGAAMIQKEKAWQQVTKEFNATSKGVTRTMFSLQQNYKNLKKKMAKKYARTNVQHPVEKTTSMDDIKDCATPSDIWEQVASSTGMPADVCQEVLIDVINKGEMKVEEVTMPILDTDEQPNDPLNEKPENMEVEMPENIKTETSTKKPKLKSDKQPQLRRKGKLQPEDKETIEENLKLIAYQKELLRIQLIEEEEKLEHNRILREMEYEDAREKYEHNALIRKLQVEKYIEK